MIEKVSDEFCLEQELLKAKSKKQVRFTLSRMALRWLEECVEDYDGNASEFITQLLREARKQKHQKDAERDKALYEKCPNGGGLHDYSDPENYCGRCQSYYS